MHTYLNNDKKTIYNVGDGVYDYNRKMVDSIL